MADLVLDCSFTPITMNRAEDWVRQPGPTGRDGIVQHDSTLILKTGMKASFYFQSALFNLPHTQSSSFKPCPGKAIFNSAYPTPMLMLWMQCIVSQHLSPRPRPLTAELAWTSWFCLLKNHGQVSRITLHRVAWCPGV